MHIISKANICEAIQLLKLLLVQLVFGRRFFDALIFFEKQFVRVQAVGARDFDHELLQCLNKIRLEHHKVRRVPPQHWNQIAVLVFLAVGDKCNRDFVVECNPSGMQWIAQRSPKRHGSRGRRTYNRQRVKIKICNR